MPPEHEAQVWITEAREHGFPVMVTGVVLLSVVLGIPLLAAAVLILIPMLAGLVCTARVAFPMTDPGD